MYIKKNLVTEPGLHEGLQKIVLFFNMMVATKTNHEIGIELKVPQRFGPLGIFVTKALFGLRNI